MKNFTRRTFLRMSTFLGFGTAVTGVAAFGETEAEATLRGVDGELARILRSYGRTRTMAEAGTQRAVVDSQARHLPAFRLGVEVRNPQAFCRSSGPLSRLSDVVLVESNTLKLARGGHYFVIENRVDWTP